MTRHEYDPNGTAYSDGRRDGFKAGFAAALAMLREPNQTLLNRVTEAVDAAANGAADDYEEWCSSKMADAAASAALAAAADAMGEAGTKKAGAE